MSNTQRIFIPGEEWLYYKIYCGARTADQILLESLQPMAARLLQNKHIDQWFFIRYGDPDFHIRIRFHLVSDKSLGTVVSEVKNALGSYVENDIIYKVQTDTYIRELERYGHQNIQTSERLFYKESALLMQLREMITDETLYFLTVIRMIDQLLDVFGYDASQKLEIASANARSFKTEFEADKYLTKQLDKKYRTHQGDIRTFFLSPEEKEEFGILKDILLNYKADCSPEIEKALHFLATTQEPLSKNSLVSSYIHMLVNRAFRSKQRFYELVCYDFLTRWYRESIYAVKK